MQTTHSPKILAFVEGEMERIFINNNFSYVRLVPVQNGDGWSVELMCKQIVSKFLVYGGNPDLIIVWIDREDREISSEEFGEAIKSSLVKNGAIAERISLMISDRMSENIMLADEEAMRLEFGIDTYKYDFEGQRGKGIMSKLMKDAGNRYKETSDGVRLLKKIRLGRSALNSPSVSRFLSVMQLDCWWVAA